MRKGQCTQPDELIKKAIKYNEVDKLLLGIGEYVYLPRLTSTQFKTDIVEVLRVFYEEVLPVENTRDVYLILQIAIYKIINLYDGILAVVTLIYMETLREKSMKSTFGLPVDKITIKLHNSIEENKDELKNLKINQDETYFDELVRLDKLIEDNGGPTFLY